MDKARGHAISGHASAGIKELHTPPFDPAHTENESVAYRQCLPVMAILHLIGVDP